MPKSDLLERLLVLLPSLIASVRRWSRGAMVRQTTFHPRDRCRQPNRVPVFNAQAVWNVSVVIAEMSDERRNRRPAELSLGACRPLECPR